ncbi:hypothetical protein E4N80_00690 [Treponema denticola]|uniref:Uncharacterized protein n=1 Tax=Treponema denticola TaxID=158 RepID=A0A9Q9BBE9_TREDN|nr:hypothetical protein [Treponema denticola]UTC91356.1 hypothetical protein E4N87_11955 [Treponema denticola]UTC99290.1 hypothetical protein E4N86_00620 [Treponema denticola]UTD04089.1 hypothetical protein E4N80_00690 [Treponema denticola]
MKGKRYFTILLLGLTTFFLHAKSLPDYELLKDNLKLVVFRKTGNFCLYNLSVRGKGKYTPLYDDRSLGRTNKFYVYKDNKVYELKKRVGKPVTIEADGDSIKIIYDFDDSFYVTQKLSFTEQTYGTGSPLLKIETIVENTSGGTAEFALKALFDTKLGEDRKIPLYTDLRTGIFRETVLEPKFEKDSAIISANSDSACLFLINHSEAKMPAQIYVANWERLQSIKWLPKAVQGRLFSTQYSHNDSALLFVWPNEVLENTDSLKVTMFIGCYDFLRKKNTSVKEEVPEKTNTPAPQDKVEPPKNEKDYQYIQALLNKILEVESNPDMASDEYIEDLIQQTDTAIQNIQE